MQNQTRNQTSADVGKCDHSQRVETMRETTCRGETILYQCACGVVILRETLDIRRMERGETW